VLTSNGRIVLAGAAKKGWSAVLSRALMGIVRSRLGSTWLVPFLSAVRLVPFLSAVRYEDLVVLKELVEAGKLRPVIDREYPLSAVPDAVRYVGSGEARAKVVINVS